MSSPAFKKRKSFNQNDSPQSPKKFKSEKVPNGRPSQGTPFKGKKHNKSFTDKSPATVVANIKKESVTPSPKTPKLKKFSGTGNLGTPKDGNIKKEPLSIKKEPASIQKEQLSAKKEQKKKQKINKQGGKEKSDSSSQGTEEKKGPNRHQKRREKRIHKKQEVREKQKNLRIKVLEGDEAARREMQEIVNELEKRPEKSKTCEKKLRYFTNLLSGDTSQPWRKTKQEKKKIIIENKNKKDKQQVQPTKKNPQGQQNPIAQKPTQKQNQLSKKNKKKEAFQKLPQPKIVANADISPKKSANKIKKQKIEDRDEEDTDDDKASDEEEVDNEDMKGESEDDDEEEEVDNEDVKGESEDDDEEDEVSDEDSDSETAAGEEDSGETSDDEASDDGKLTISNKLKKTAGGEDDEESEEEEDESSEEEEDESSEEDSDDDTSNQIAKNNLPKQNVNKNKPQQQKVENKNKIKNQPNVKDILDKDKPGRYVVFVGNLPYTSTKEELREHFKKAGEITDIRIPTDKDTNKPKGFAYVEVGDSDAYQKALSLHHTFLGSRRINVLYTQGGKKKSDAQKQEIKAKNFKLHAMRQQGQLAGSVKADQKRSVRRAKKRQFEKTE